ncbi:PREDICTED: uncharacterized protein LOC106807569 [Priapulus caudatus]|uniref:Uncharacterized protein LOC106807569 n=1 Tax=Priapulus caudatus TaxID=37621 RepID=A0ABM1DZQ5_PRICU|nr:PREDICTED: uncharacterized protein LOC106807569 [Priapulus caudatus]XP_014665427.1 PREDICTED: uncharacterized protein LOC106807569 [Priapulus caudatus]
MTSQVISAQTSVREKPNLAESARRLLKRLTTRGASDGRDSQLPCSADASPSDSDDAASALADQDTLPQTFSVRYLGRRPTRGLWGIRHTRHPVESLIDASRGRGQEDALPALQLQVSKYGIHTSVVVGSDGVSVGDGDSDAIGLRPIDTISYGVQDVKYSRVFAMIVVRGDAFPDPDFECHAYVCESRQGARRLACALAFAFKEFGRECMRTESRPRRFAIDLRSAEEIEKECSSQEQDSEA